MITFTLFDFVIFFCLMCIACFLPGAVGEIHRLCTRRKIRDRSIAAFEARSGKVNSQP